MIAQGYSQSDASRNYFIFFSSNGQPYRSGERARVRTHQSCTESSALYFPQRYKEQSLKRQGENAIGIAPDDLLSMYICGHVFILSHIVGKHRKAEKPMMAALLRSKPLTIGKHRTRYDQRRS